MGATVYQIEYSNDVVGAFDPAFIKYDCRDKPEAEKREIAHMLRFYDEGIWQRHGSEPFGLVSPKFAGKAGITGKAFINWVDANPGHDVYFINPFPQLCYWQFNVWTQGEFWHPGLTDLADAIFAAAGFSTRIDNLPRNTAASLLYSNYWVGSEKFWHTYMAFVRRLVVAVEALDASDKKKLFDRAPHYAPATYFPFVFERLFSTFLLMQEKLSCLPYPHTHQEIIDRCDNDMERFILQEWAGLIDSWDANGRKDAEYRKLFANLQGMLKIYQSAVPCPVGHAPADGRGLIDKMKHTLSAARPRISTSCGLAEAKIPPASCNNLVSVIIVNWNGEQFLERCLTSLMEQTVQPHEILLVDNASTDGSLEIARRFEAVRLIALDRNTGFARGNNLALELASAESAWIALINPDAFAEPRWLEQLLAAAESHAAFDVFGSKLVNALDPTVCDGTGDAYHLSGLVWRVGHGQSTPAATAVTTEQEIFSPCAAAAMYRRRSLCELGGFDEDYFCYVEDVDLGFRLRLAGCRCLYVPQSVAHHIGSATTGGKHSDFALYYGHRNLVWTFVKDMPGILFWLLLPLHAVLNLTTIIWFILHGQGRVILRAKRDALLGLPKMYRKRQSIQKTRVASLGQIWRQLHKGMISTGERGIK